SRVCKVADRNHSFPHPDVGVALASLVSGTGSSLDIGGIEVSAANGGNSVGRVDFEALRAQQDWHYRPQATFHKVQLRFPGAASRHILIESKVGMFRQRQGNSAAEPDRRA